MNKKLLLIVGVVIVALGAFFFLKKPTGPMSGVGGDQTISASLAQLVMMGEDYTCTFETTDETGVEHAGTVAIADGGTKMDGTFTATKNDSSVETYNMIRDGEYTYFWSAAEAKGYKMKIDPESETLWDTSTQPEEDDFYNDQPMDFSCSPLTMKVGLFTPPTDVEFMDLTAQMEMMQQYNQATPVQMPDGAQQDADSENDMSQYCGACAQLKGSAKTQCLTAMKCAQ